MTPIIQAQALTRRYGDFLAVAGIDFEVAEGEFFGLLGPNGAGKTSTIKMISCVQDVTSGLLLVGGLDVRTNDREVKSLVGVVPQDDNLDQDLTVRQNLEVYARYFGIGKRAARERIDEGLALMQLEEKADESINALSGGMKRRLVIARALVNEPRLLILDEPTTGLDPQARHLVWRKLRLLRERGTTILLTTHYMDEAEQLCDRLIIMDNGKALSEGRPRDLIGEHAGREVLELHLPPEETARVVERLTPMLGESGRIEQVEDVAYAYGIDESHYRMVEEMASDPYRVIFRRANLEDVFLTLTGRGLVE
ncbi:MAG: ABC transporter ATP-binding protein [Dehalococcoidia bacterium]|nr:ABC transporter ATP-binding protein [Dehalococcoidia bacterium]MCB9483669.1 ABC transporter ATP-binding protein [Dehalococcoidia bacterium]